MIGIGPNLSHRAAYLHKSGASLEYDFTLGTLTPIAGSEAITFTRSTIATAINAIGNVETLAINQPRFDYDVNTIAQQNLVTYSEQFDNAAWTKSNESVTANSVTGPFGALSADTLTATAGSGAKYVFALYTATAAGYTISVFAKAGTSNWVSLSPNSGAASTDGAYFNLATGVVGTVASGSAASIRAVGDGWFRCSVTRTLTAATYSINITVNTADNQANTWTAAGTETVYICGAQVTLATGYGSPELITNGTFDTATTGWTATGTTSLSVVSGKLQVTQALAGGGQGYQAITTVAGRTYIISAFCANGTTSEWLVVGTSAGNNSLLSAIPTSGITSVYSFVATGTTTYIGLANNSAGAGLTSYFDNISVKELNYLPYTPTTSAAATVKYACKGLLIEEARTNLATYAQELDNAAWTKSNQTVTADSIASPDGTTTADTVTASAGSGSKNLNKGFAATAVAYTGSVYAKAGTTNWLGLAITGNTALDDGAFFNLSTGVVGTVQSGTTATMESVGNGWYRCSITRTLTSSTRFILLEVHTADAQATTYTAAGTETLYLWGVQVELGAFSSSYIPTTTATVTRAQDVATVSNVTPWHNQPEGTIVLEADNTGYVSTPQVDVCISANTDLQEFLMYAYDNALVSVATVGGVAQANFSSSAFLPKVPYKIAMAYKANDFAVSLNGAAAQTDVSGSVPTGITKLNIGGRYDASLPKTGHIRKFAYHPRRIADAELVMLTA